MAGVEGEVGSVAGGTIGPAGTCQITEGLIRAAEQFERPAAGRGEPW